MKILVHPNLPAELTQLLTDQTISAVVHWSQVGDPEATDSLIFAYAASQGFVVLCGHLGFKRIFGAMTSEVQSLLQVSADEIALDQMAGHILDAINQRGDDLTEGAIVMLELSGDGPQTRSLPLPKSGSGTGQPVETAFTRIAFFPAGMFQEPDIPEQVRQLAKMCSSINNLSVMRLQDVRFRSDDPNQIVAALLFAQATTRFEGACVLAKSGMDGEARVLARSCLEAAIVGYAMATKPELDMIAKLNASHLRHYKTWLDALRGKIGLRKDEPLDEYLSGIIDSMDGISEGSFTLEQLARESGIGTVYTVLYRYLSADAGHPSWDSLRSVAAHDDTTGRLIGLSVRPRFEQTGETLWILARFQLLALQAFQISFPSRDIDSAVGVINEMLSSLEMSVAAKAAKIWERSTQKE